MGRGKRGGAPGEGTRWEGKARDGGQFARGGARDRGGKSEGEHRGSSPMRVGKGRV